MDRKLSPLCTLGGATGILTGLVLVASGCWFIFAAPNTGIVGILHGVGIVTLILLVPTLVATYVLLNSEVGVRSTLGVTFALFWVLIELLAHCSQTAPLRALSELAATDAGVVKLWEEWGEALFMTSAFLCVLMALCYGTALHSWGNHAAAYLFFVSIIAFPVGVWLIPDGAQDPIFREVALHVIFRGVAFFFLGGVLIRAPQDEDNWLN